MTLEFYYVVAGNTTVVLDVGQFATNVFNSTSYTTEKTDGFEFNQINFDVITTDPNATGGGASSTVFANIFRSKK